MSTQEGQPHQQSYNPVYAQAGQPQQPMMVYMAPAQQYGQQTQPYGQQAHPYGQQAQPYGTGQPMQMPAGAVMQPVPGAPGGQPQYVVYAAPPQQFVSAPASVPPTNSGSVRCITITAMIFSILAWALFSMSLSGPTNFSWSHFRMETSSTSSDDYFGLAEIRSCSGSSNCQTQSWDDLPNLGTIEDCKSAGKGSAALASLALICSLVSMIMQIIVLSRSFNPARGKAYMRVSLILLVIAVVLGSASAGQWRSKCHDKLVDFYRGLFNAGAFTFLSYSLYTGYVMCILGVISAGIAWIMTLVFECKVPS